MEIRRKQASNINAWTQENLIFPSDNFLDVLLNVRIRRIDIKIIDGVFFHS